MSPITALLSLIISLYSWVVLIYVLLRLLIQFKVVNAGQPLVARAVAVLGDLTEPVLNKIRKYVKPYNNIDLSPVVLLIILWFVQYCLRYYFY